MDRRRAAAALLALAACFACSAAAPTANNQTALELLDGTTEGCYYNFQHYGEGDRIMTNEPCLNCTCHNRMLMCYLRVCPFTKPIGQDCTVEKRADQCCPIVTCPDVPVDLLTSTSTSSPAEYGSTGVGKYDRYGCSINGKYFSEGSKVPSTPNKPCEHCYCIRNMTTCVMQECTLHVDGCTPIYHKDVCCPVRYSCDHEDEIPLLDDMTTTERPTPGYILTTTTVLPVTQMTQDCVHDDQIFPDGALIKTEKACEHCYCMKGDIVCVVQECGTPMENEGKNCTSLPPRHGQCCPDTYICEGDDHGTDLTTETTDLSTQPPRRTGDEGSGYRNEPDEPFTEVTPFEIDTEGSGEDYVTAATIHDTNGEANTEKVSPEIIDEMLLATTDGQFSQTTEPDKGQNTIPDTISDKVNTDLLKPEKIPIATEMNEEFGTTLVESKTTASDEFKHDNEQPFITTESAFRKDDNNMVSDEIITLKDNEKSSTTLSDLVDETTPNVIHLADENIAKDHDFAAETTTKDDHLVDEGADHKLETQDKTTTQAVEYTSENENDMQEKEITTENQPLFSTTEIIPESIENEVSKTSTEHSDTGITIAPEKIDIPETTSANPVTNEVDDTVSYPGRIPGEGDCLLNGITYTNNSLVPSSNNCHTSCKCTSSIIKCDPIICSPPPEYMENMNDCQPIYDSPDACCPTYVCSGKETIPPQSHSQMSGTESPKPIVENECNGEECTLNKEAKPDLSLSSTCESADCLNKPDEKQQQTHIPPLVQDCSNDKCEIAPVGNCKGDECENKPYDLESPTKPILEEIPPVSCNEKDGCEKPKEEQEKCQDENCRREDSSEVDKSNTEIPGKPISTTNNEPTTEMSELDVTKQGEIFTVSSEISTVPDTSSEQHVSKEQSEHPEVSTTQKIPKKSDETFISTEKTETDLQGINDAMKPIEEISNESDSLTTKTPELEGSKDMVVDITQTERVTTVKQSFHDDSPNSLSGAKESENNVTDQTENATEKLEIYTESMPETTKPDVMDDNSSEKLTTNLYDQSPTDKTITSEKILEIDEIRQELTTPSVLLDIVTKETEIHKNPELNEVSEEPNQILEHNTEESPEEHTESAETSGLLELSTEKSNEAVLGEVTDRNEPHEENTSDISELNTESNIIMTDHTQSLETKKDENSKDVTPEIISYTETPEYLSTKTAEIYHKITTEQSVQYTDSLPTTQVKLDISDSKTPSTERSEQENTSTQTVMREEINTETPTIPFTKLDEPMTETITEKQYDFTVKDEELTKDHKSTTIEKLEVYTDSPKIYTTISDQQVTKKDEEQDSSSNLPELYTTAGLDLTSIEQVTDTKDISPKDSETLVTEKVSDLDKYLHSTLENEISTAKSFEESTEEISPINTESTPLEAIPEKSDGTQATSVKPNLIDEQEVDKLVTMIPDIVQNQETTTVSRDEIGYDGQTQTPIDDKIQTLSTETTTKISLETNKDIEIITPQLTDSEKIVTTPSSQSTILNEDTTEQYNTESQKKDTILDVTISKQDYTTKPSLIDEINVDVISTSKTQDELEITTTKQQQMDEEEKESSPPLIETEIPSSTTSRTVSLKEMETESLAYTTETIVDLDRENANKQSTDVIGNEQTLTTTDKTLLEEEHLPLSTHENKPEEDTTQNVNFDTEHKMPTEKVILPETFETEGPTHVITTEPSLTESSVAQTNVDNNEEISRLPDTYETSTEPDKISSQVQTDEPIESTHKPLSEIEDKEQILTTTTSIQFEDENIATITPLLVTHKTPMIIEDISENNVDESDLELTTKYTHDQTIKTNEDHTVELDLYTTVSHSQSTESSKQELAQKDEKIMTSESPAYTATSHVGEEITPSLHETGTVEQELNNEVQTDQSENTQSVSDAKTTSPRYNMLDAEGTTIVPIKEETLDTDDQRRTPEKASPHLPDYETTVAIDKIMTEKSSEEITTIPPKILESGNDNIVTNPADEYEITTVPSELYHHETEASDKNEVPDIFETITTENIKPNVIETNEVVTVNYPSKETLTTDKPTEMVTEHRFTEISEVSEITSTEGTKVVSEKQEFDKTDFTKEDIETTEPPYVTLSEHKESSTEEAGLGQHTKVSDENVTDEQERVTIASEGVDKTKTEKPIPPHISDYPETTVSIIEYQTQSDNKDKIEATDTYTQSPKETITEKKDDQQFDLYSTQPSIEKETKEPVGQEGLENIPTEDIVTDRLPDIPDLSLSTEKYDDSNLFSEKYSTTSSGYKYSETTPFLVELTEHAHHLVDEPTTRASLEEITTVITDLPQPERGDQIPEDLSTNKDEYQTSEESKTTVYTPVDGNIQTTLTPSKTEAEIVVVTEKAPAPSSIDNKEAETETDASPALDGGETSTTHPQIIKEYATELTEKQQTSSLATLAYDETSTKKDFTTEKPEMFDEKTTSEATKVTASKPSEESSSYLPPHTSKPEEKPFDTILPNSTHSPDIQKPEFTDDLNEDLPAPDIPSSGSGGYGQEEYVDEDQAFGPGTCRYGGKVYVSAQQIPRDDPCDFCFCFRSDIICLQQSCPPPIHGCHEEPIQGFCCPRYECPVSMATTLNVTTTTTTTTTTLPPHFLPHAYKGAAQRKGCQIKGHTYKVGEVVRASSGPCLHCTCGGDGQMKCDPKACTPEPMLRQMIAAAVSAKRRR